MEASLLIQCIITGKQSNYYCDETKKMALKLQTDRAKPSLSWATVGPSKDKHQAATHQWKFSAKVVIVSDALPTVNFMHFLLQNDVFHCSAWQMKLKLPHWNADLSLYSNFCDFRFWPFQIK